MMPVSADANSACAWVRTVVLVLLLHATGSLLHAEELVPIFTGTNLDGWVQRGGKPHFGVVDGMIVGTTVKGTGNSFLCTDREYGDFILELEIKADKELNSGVQIRSHCFVSETVYDFGGRIIKIPAGRVHGYQVEVDHRPERRWSGGIYEEGRREWLFPLATNAPAGQAFKFGEWNRYRIVCIGDSIRTWINGVPAADLVDAESLRGFIGLQVHASETAGLKVRFRNVRLEDLGEHHWRPAWNGETFDGGHILGKGDWKIEPGGVLHATHSKDEKEYGHLVSNGSLADFTVRMKYKAIKGNSGFYFRIEEKGASGVSGFQAEIDAEKDAGGLYETNGRGWVSQPSAADVMKWFKPQEWNTMTVSAHGKRLTVTVNGHKSAEVFDDPGRAEGNFALQLHGGQDVEIFFKDLEILQSVD
jgi:hypothetical protein